MPKSRISKPRKPYHHGNLVEALLAVTVEIIGEQGVDRLSLREVARRTGVSPAAPFQHFRSKTALLTAVADQAMGRLTEAVLAAEEEVEDDSPLARFEAIGQGYLRWALANPTHFAVISSRTLIDVEASDILRGQNDAIRQRMVHLLKMAIAAGELPEDTDVDQLVLTGRAFVYGLARMAIDGHFPEWHPSEPPQQATRRALAFFIDRLRLPSR